MTDEHSELEKQNQKASEVISSQYNINSSSNNLMKETLQIKCQLIN